MHRFIDCCCAAQDAAQALGLWDDATKRLQSAASLDVGDVSPLNALGDVHSGRADRLLASQPAEVRQACCFSPLLSGCHTPFIFQAYRLDDLPSFSSWLRKDVGS